MHVRRLAALLCGLLVLGFTAGPLWADDHPAPPARQAEAPSTPPALHFSLKSFGSDFLQDAGDIWSYPVHIQKQGSLALVALALSALVLIPNDEAIHRGVDKIAIDHDGDDRLSPLVSQMGSYGAWGAVGAFLGIGLLTRNQKALETGALAASAMLQSALVVRVGKMLTGRQRPFAGAGVDDWDGPPGYFRRDAAGRSLNYDSFPSGHTATAFSLATVIAMQYGDHAWVPITAYAVATGVGISRLTGNKHWLSDVVVGGLLGHVIARLVVRNFRVRHRVRPLVAVGPGYLAVGASVNLGTQY
jgi:membrane-associated phospholipid phosphatase